MSWWYKDEKIEIMPEDVYGFIYKIEIANKTYYGKKIAFSTKKKWFGKKKLATMTDARLKKYEYVKKPSNWLTYCSSSKVVEQLVKDGNTPLRMILMMCYSKKELTYRENQILYKPIEDDDCINDNISGMFYRDEIVNFTKEVK